jgi:hypothetical protein
VDAPEAAVDPDDGGAAASIALGLGTEQVRYRGFPDWFDEVRIAKVVAGVRYRTSGTFQDDLYRIEASPTGVFEAPPGHAFTTTDWNFYTPIVGGGGPNAPASNEDYPDARLLVLPHVASYREASALVTTNPVLDPGAANYRWPALTHEDLATLEVRVVAAPLEGGAVGSSGRVEVDAFWLDLYGWEAERPVEAANLRVDTLADGTVEVSFDPVPGADRYNLYWGTLDAIATGAYDHGADADCAAATADAGGGRLKIAVPPGAQPAGDAYAVVTAHVDDVESPAGFASDGTEHDRAQSTCR